MNEKLPRNEEFKEKISWLFSVLLDNSYKKVITWQRHKFITNDIFCPLFVGSIGQL